MSILEPRPDYASEDPLLDAVLGLYASAHRARATIERLAPAVSASVDDALPQPFIALLLGVLSTSEAVLRVTDEACPPAPPVTSPPKRSPPPRGSLWR